MLNNLTEQDAFHCICWLNVSVGVSNWYERLWPKIRTCTPRRTKHREQESLPPWSSPETSSLLQRLRIISEKHCKWHVKYVQANNALCAALNRDKSDYDSRIAETRNTKLLFNLYKSFTKTSYPAKLYLGNTKVESDLDKANLFAYFFSCFYFEPNRFVYDILGTECAFASFLILVELFINESVFLKLCKLIYVNKSRGPNNLPPIILKKCAHSLSHSLFQIFKKSCQTSTYPHS